MSNTWLIKSVKPAPGARGQLLVFDPHDGPEGRTVCIIPGSLVWQASSKTMVRLLDEQDIENARLIAVAPQMRLALAALIEWAARMGDWSAPCWGDAKSLLNGLRDPPPVL